MKGERGSFAKILILALAFSLPACQKRADSTENSPSISSAPKSNSNLTIDQIDFKNFTYPYSDVNDRTFTLINGKKPFGKVEDIAFDYNGAEFTDLTGDLKNEAVITLSVHLAVSDKNAIYVYTLEDNQPKLLLYFWTGEKAEGGLKGVYSEDGKLIIETFGESKFENDKWNFNLPKNNVGGLCCPDIFTRISFKWNGEKFVVEGNPELFDYDSRNHKRED